MASSSRDDPDWDSSQLEVIWEAPERRLLVDAGPGTGKTAVACARIAYLINDCGLKPSGIWLVSFTRTAVKEIRERIGSYLNDPDSLYGIKIATVDSHAWSIHQGFSPDAKITESFDDNIEQVINLIENDDEAQEYIEQTEHLIVDESQDLIGIRANLIVRLVQKLRPEAGVTVFGDEAQAIYGFSSESGVGTSAIEVKPLRDRLLSLGGFVCVGLDTVHRTDDKSLLHIFTAVRANVIAPGVCPSDRLREVRAAITGSAHSVADKPFDPEKPPGHGVFVLFRRRSEVMQASSFLSSKGVSHRLRMSGLPPHIPAWLGASLGGHTESALTEAEFRLRCEGMTTSDSRPFDPDVAWRALSLIAPTRRAGAIDMLRLRSVMGKTNPPVDLTLPDFGTSGPILGTIHAAKGREADDVWMMLPPVSGEGGDGKYENLEEETRVVFVGATRARKSLHIGRGYRQAMARNLSSSGRVFMTDSLPGKARVEIGRVGDIVAEGLASRRLIASEGDALEMQNRLSNLSNAPLLARAYCDREADFAYRLATMNGDIWGSFAKTLNTDLFSISRKLGDRGGGGQRRPPDFFPHLYIFGARTIVLRPDDPMTEGLFQPWRSSGIVLAPLVYGFSMTLFPVRSRGSYGR